MKLGRIARLYIPPAFVLTVLAVQRTPTLGTGVRVLAGWNNPPNEPQGAGDPDAGLDAGDDAGIDAGTGSSTDCGGGNEHLATTSTLGAGCC